MDRVAAVKRIACMLAAVTSVSANASAAPLGAVEADRQRISAHLARVERVLLDKDVSALSPELLRERNRNIERLREYRTRGEFPHNSNHPGERVPYFIDRDGRACAVGALIIASGHATLAARVSSTENNALLADMTTPGLSDWVANSGLSLAECARIQPSYCDESLCTDGTGPVCGMSGESYDCLRVLDECSDDEYAYDGECVDGAPDSGPVLVQSHSDQGNGCSVRRSDSTAWLSTLACMIALASLRRRARDCQ
jgi:hypothetical protein